MTHITCRLTARNRDQLLNPTLGNRLWATFTFLRVDVVALTTTKIGSYRPHPPSYNIALRVFSIMLFPLASIRRCVISVEQFRTLSRHCSICTEHIPNRCLHSWIPCPFSDCRLTAVLCAIIRKHKAKKWTNKRKYSSQRCMILSQRERARERSGAWNVGKVSSVWRRRRRQRRASAGKYAIKTTDRRTARSQIL